MWQDNAIVEEARTTREGATGYCKNLNLAGHQDWRTPSLHELISLLDEMERWREGGGIEPPSKRSTAHPIGFEGRDAHQSHIPPVKKNFIVT